MCGVAGWHLRQETIGKIPEERYKLMAFLGACENMTRGQDATGYAQFHNQQLYVNKTNIAVQRTTKEFWDRVQPSTITLLHTRASTNGDPEHAQNNHPVVYGDWAVTHNGTIQSHKKIRDNFVRSGMNVDHIEVDSVAIPVFVDSYVGENNWETVLTDPELLLDLTWKMGDLFEGPYVFHLVNKNTPNRSVLVRGQTSPLIVAETEYGIFYGSEPHSVFRMIQASGLDISEESVYRVDEGYFLSIHDGVIENAVRFVPKNDRKTRYGKAKPQLVRRHALYGQRLWNDTLSAYKNLWGNEQVRDLASLLSVRFDGGPFFSDWNYTTDPDKKDKLVQIRFFEGDNIQDGVDNFDPEILPALATANILGVVSAVPQYPVGTKIPKVINYHLFYDLGDAWLELVLDRSARVLDSFRVYKDQLEGGKTEGGNVLRAWDLGDLWEPFETEAEKQEENHPSVLIGEHEGPNDLFSFMVKEPGTGFKTAYATKEEGGWEIEISPFPTPRQHQPPINRGPQNLAKKNNNALPQRQSPIRKQLTGIKAADYSNFLDWGDGGLDWVEWGIVEGVVVPLTQATPCVEHNSSLEEHGSWKNFVACDEMYADFVDVLSIVDSVFDLVYLYEHLHKQVDSVPGADSIRLAASIESTKNPCPSMEHDFVLETMTKYWYDADPSATLYLPYKEKCRECGALAIAFFSPDIENNPSLRKFYTLSWEPVSLLAALEGECD